MSNTVSQPYRCKGCPWKSDSEDYCLWHEQDLVSADALCGVREEEEDEQEKPR